MDINEGLDFVRKNHRAVLTTLRAAGRPQMSPVLASVDGDGRVAVSSRETAYKVANLRRDPRASLCALSDDFWKWVQIDGRASLVSLPEAMEPLIELYRSISGEHPDWDDYRRAMAAERRVVIRIEVERVGPERSG